VGRVEFHLDRLNSNNTALSGHHQPTGGTLLLPNRNERILDGPAILLSMLHRMRNNVIAADFSVPSTGPGNFSYFNWTGQSLGWSGSGQFTHSFTVNPINNSFGPEWTPWGWQAYSLDDEKLMPFDGVEILRDLTSLEIDYIAPDIPGDFNGDGRVDSADYLVWRENFGESESTLAPGSGNGNEIVDGSDFLVWREHFGGTGGRLEVVSEQSIPEPTSIAMAVVAGLMVCGGWSRFLPRLPNAAD